MSDLWAEYTIEFDEVEYEIDEESVQQICYWIGEEVKILNFDWDALHRMSRNERLQLFGLNKENETTSR